MRTAGTYAALSAVVIYVCFYFGIIGLLGYVAWHFISKFW